MKIKSRNTKCNKLIIVSDVQSLRQLIIDLLEKVDNNKISMEILK